MNKPLNAREALTALLSSDRQKKRLFRMDFPKGDGPAGAMLVLNRIDANEGVSRDFQFNLEVLADDPRIPLKEVLGKMVTVEQVREDESRRYYNGYVFDFRFIRNDSGFAVYDMVLMPWMAFLRYRKDNYIFHNKAVQDQTAIVFADYSMADWGIRNLTADPEMTDAVQFDESDYNYLHRRWEARGWHYWYEHRKDGHTLMLSGDSLSCDPIDGKLEVKWEGEVGLRRRGGLWSFSPIRTVASTAYAASSFDFKKPRPVNVDVPTVNQQGKVPEPLEVYESTGAYGFKNAADGDAFVRMRIEEIEAAGKHFNGAGDNDCLQPGRWFRLVEHYDLFDKGGEDDDAFLVLEVGHIGTNNYEVGGMAEYRNRIVCLRKKIPWRPGRGFNSIEPRIQGVQTAIVVGPPGEEIHCDEYGRVRVQFHWDREGSYDQKSSAWIRVASMWAGSNFGAIAIPRIGQEVVVHWLDGNPDRPLIIGSVYNQQHMPPWDLPGAQRQTGILSRSTKGGGYDNANAFRLDDTKGQEEVWLRAERDNRIEVEHDETHWVGRDRSKTIDRDETVVVHRDRTETVDNNETITVHNNRTERVDNNEAISIGGNRTEDVGKNETISIAQNQSITIGQSRTKTVVLSETISIGQGRSVSIGGNSSQTIAGMKSETVAQAKTETVGLAKALSVGAAYQVSVGGAMNTSVGQLQAEQVGASKTVNVGADYSIKAGSEFSITVGSASFSMKSDGTIAINGKDITLQGSGDIGAKAGGNIALKGTQIDAN